MLVNTYLVVAWHQVHLEDDFGEERVRVFIGVSVRESDFLVKILCKLDFVPQIEAVIPKTRLFDNTDSFCTNKFMLFLPA